MIINNESHISRPWKVNEIANDFILWDGWEIPMAANNSKTENFQSFYRKVNRKINVLFIMNQGGYAGYRNRIA